MVTRDVDKYEHNLINRTLLYEEEFIKSVSWHLVKKLTITEKDSKRVIQLLEGLSVLCTCKGDPIKQNQSKDYLAILQNQSKAIFNYLAICTCGGTST